MMPYMSQEMSMKILLYLILLKLKLNKFKNNMLINKWIKLYNNKWEIKLNKLNKSNK